MHTLSARKAAACELLLEHPDWSTRRIARATGLAPRTVELLRHRSDQEIRVGRNGRLRPLNIERGRLAAQTLLEAHPHLSLRDVADRVGISPNTVRDVRDRMRRGEDPVRRTTGVEALLQIPARRGRHGHEADPADADGPRPIAQALPILRSDPTLRYTVAGRQLIALLTRGSITQHTIDDLVSAVPAHVREQVAACARECADTWQTLAFALERTSRRTGGGQEVR